MYPNSKFQIEILFDTHGEIASVSPVPDQQLINEEGKEKGN